MSETRKSPGLLMSLLPVGVLILLLALSTRWYGSDSSYGPNQIALILAAGLVCLQAWRLGFKWQELEAGIVRGISHSLGAILILLAVGSLIGTWVLAGVVPTMIHYGLLILSPALFYPAACVICIVVSLATGSSWTTASTVGIALIGISQALGMHPGLSAGAIISGAYFGDKMSPLSDTTNLAPAMAGTDLFTHIRHMTWTTAPSIALAVVLFLVIGLTRKPAIASVDLATFSETLQQQFTIGPHLLIPAALVIFLVVRKVPAFPALLIGALAGGLFAIAFQGKAVAGLVGESELSPAAIQLKGVWTALYGGYVSNTGVEAIDKLLTRGGMASMLNTVWLILSAMVFGAVMETTGMLGKLAQAVLAFARSTGSLIAATLATSTAMNIIASDQYIAIVIPGRMYRAEFRRRGLHPKNLSRALEDAGTLTSPLVPWNTCGAFMAGSLGVATGTYWMYCFFNLLNPIISAIYGFTGFTIETLPESESGDEEVSAASQPA